MKDVIISIKGNQSSSGSGADVIELVTNGTYDYSAEESVLSYMESQLTGMEGTCTTFRVGQEGVTMTREGSVNSQMVFQQGRRHFFFYDTPFGGTAMGVDTRKLRRNFREDGGEMEISYVLDVDNMVISENKFSIQFQQRIQIKQ